MKSIEEFVDQVINGDSFKIIKEMPDESVNLILTSPPYFGCRVYGDETLGREANPLDYLKHLFEFTKEFKRILKKDGSFYLNMGDLYFGHKGFHRGYKPEHMRKTHKNYEHHDLVAEDGKYFQTKQLMLLPPRLAIMMQDDGWIVRNQNLWQKCLEENTKLFIKRNGKYQITRVKDLYGDFSDSFVPSQNSEGQTVWVKIKRVLNVGIKSGLKIITKKGNEIIVTGNHRFPFRIDACMGKKFRKIRLKSASELNKTNRLYCNNKLDIDLPDGTTKDYDEGFFVGFFVAEGNYIFRDYNAYKDNKLSLAVQKRFGRSSRGRREVGVQLSCGKSDMERGYISRVNKVFCFNINVYGNKIHLNKKDIKIVEFIKKYVYGNVCDEKHLKMESFNRSKSFLMGILDGFLAGDGGYEKETKRWRVGIKPNYNLKDELQMICRIFGYKFRYNGISSVRIKGRSKIYSVMKFIINKEKSYKINSFDCVLDKISKIDFFNSGQFFDIEVEPIYTGKRGNNQYKKENIPTKNEIKQKYNNLYFLMNGIWTHNSNPVPSFSDDRRMPVYEYFYHFVKTKSYHFDFELAKKLNHHRDIINCGIEPFGNHQATFPEKLIYPFIVTTSNEGDVVLDPFGGTGTVGVVSKRCKRKYIVIELSNDFCIQARARIYNTGGDWING